MSQRNRGRGQALSRRDRDMWRGTQGKEETEGETLRQETDRKNSGSGQLTE